MDLKNSIKDMILKLDNNRGLISDEVLKNTPLRMENFYREIFSGLDISPTSFLKERFFVKNNDLIIEKDISFYSMCEHHFLPFFGKIAVAYVPNNYIVGFGSIIKVIEALSKRPQLQERLTDEIATILYEELKCSGVIVFIEAEHTWMTMRGVKAIGTKIVTTSSKGIFLEDANLKNEFFTLLK